jgi:hypothetical protein
LNDDDSNIGQLQDYICSVVFTAKQKHSATKFQCERCNVVLCLYLFHNLPCQGTFLKHMVITCGKVTTSRNVVVVMVVVAAAAAVAAVVVNTQALGGIPFAF